MLWLISSLFFAVSTVVVADEKPMVTVYYESLCPDSIRFVTRQLYPSYASPMRAFYNLKLVPYGKSQLVSGTSPATWQFSCHHGPRECYGNKVHGCALEHVYDLETSLRFIVCLMKKTLEDKTAPYPVEECADLNNVNGQEIVQCANFTTGTGILKRNQEETDRLMTPLSNVPTIVFNNRFDKKTQEMAVENFASTLCKHLDNPPHACMLTGAGARSLAALSLLLVVAAPFIL